MDVMKPLFTDKIMDTPLPPRFRLPQAGVYSGQWDPTDYLESYRFWIELHGTSKAIMCKAFSLALTGSARRWFRQLELGSISSFLQLWNKIVAQFIKTRQSKKPLTHLLSATQCADESLRDYVVHFKVEVVQVEGYSDRGALTAIMMGLKPGKFLWSLLRNPPRTYTDLLCKAQRYQVCKNSVLTVGGYRRLLYVKRTRKEHPYECCTLRNKTWPTFRL